ncbi:MAG: ComEC/Rec2 family competence protein [Ruminococcaceae bacterium]|nr:ComEC/Rec2 family competence protein [Oscillospiraceae bacterium]
MSRPFAVIGFTLFFVTALLFEFEIGVTVTAFAIFAAALIVSLITKNVRRNRFLPTLFASAAVACILLVSETLFVYNPAMEYDGRTGCQIKAQITSLPEIRYGNCYYEAKTVSVDGEDAQLKLRFVFSAPLEAEPYDVVEGRFSVFALGTSSEDLLQSYKSEGVFLGAYPETDDYVVHNIDESHKPFAKKILDLREGIKSAVYRIMPDERGALAVALLIGDKSGLPGEIYSDFRSIGISHIICVSGYHLSLWSTLILLILKKTRLDYRLSNLFALAGVVLFMFIAGFTYSVVRAGVMMIIFLVGNIFMRQRDSLNSLGIALSALTVCRPFSAGSVSLQLSALATMGIILYSLLIEPDIRKITDKISVEKLCGAVRKLLFPLMVTVSATAFTLPVALSINGSFNFLSFGANLVAVPVAGWCMTVIALGAALGCVVPDFVNLPALAAKWLCSVLIKFSSWLADFDFFSFKVSSEKIMLIFCGIFMFCITAVFVSAFRKPVYSVAAAVCAVMFCVCMVTFSINESAQTKITVVDCGNGTSVLVSTKGENVLIGGGGDDILGAYRINNALLSCGGGLDAVFVPTDDNTDSSYLLDVFASYRPETIYCNELPEGLSLLTSRSKIYSFDEFCDTENILVKSYNCNNNYCAILKTDDICLAACFDPCFDFSVIDDGKFQPDIVISRGSIPQEIICYTGSLCILNAEKTRGQAASEYYAGTGKTVIITGGEGNVVLYADKGALKAERE